MPYYYYYYYYYYYFVSLLITFSLSTSAFRQQTTTCPFQSIYQFGDSISDTGNLIRKGGQAASHSSSAHPPYGQTYFHHPTGRCSVGLLIIDYIATALRLPFLPPYLDKNASFHHGANFAVAGSTALGRSFFASRNIHTPLSNTPLRTQLDWFKSPLKSLDLSRSLIMMGEIGGNDYNNAFFQGKSNQEIITYIPFVVNEIMNAIREIINLSGTRIVVPGNFPIGCIPIYLTSFPNSNPRAYDEFGCLRGLNQFARRHNYYLQRALALLRIEFPDVVIVYADYYSAFESVLRRAPYIGFDQGSLLKACCGIGGLYNYDGSRMCGSRGVPVCEKPSERIHWDGIHLTQEAYHRMSEVLINDILSRIQCVW